MTCLLACTGDAAKSRYRSRNASMPCLVPSERVSNTSGTASPRSASMSAVSTARA